MSFLSRFNPLTGLRDLRLFLAARQKHELVFGFLAIMTTMIVMTGFMIDARDLKKPYKRDIQYVENWRLDRTDAEIIAAQKEDAKTRAVAEAEFKKQQAARRAEFKKVDDWLSRWGL